MTGAHHRRDGRRAGRRPQTAGLVWLLTIVSILQWTAPHVDPWLFARLNGTPVPERSLLADGHSSPAIDAQSGAAPVSFEKRSGGQRSLPSTDDPESVTEAIPATTARMPRAGPAAAATVSAFSHDGQAFTARSPPDIG